VELRDDAATRVVIVTGAPPVFSAGADAGLKSTMSATSDARRSVSARVSSGVLFERANTLLEGLEQATIAMINGHAVGRRLGLDARVRFRWAAAETQLWIPEVDLGVPLGVASTTRFVRLVGPPARRRSSWSAGGTPPPKPRPGGSCIASFRARPSPRKCAPTPKPSPQAVQGDGGGQGSHQRDCPYRHPRGQRDDGGIPRSWLTAR